MSEDPQETRDDGGRIACPACSEEWGDLWDYGWGNEESLDIECPHCEATLTLTRNVSVRYAAMVRK